METQDDPNEFVGFINILFVTFPNQSQYSIPLHSIVTITTIVLQKLPYETFTTARTQLYFYNQ